MRASVVISAAVAALVGFGGTIALIVAAWSTPGAALIAASSGIRIEEAVGAFLLAGALIVATAAFRSIGRLIKQIPPSIAAGLLAGVLIRFVIGVFESAGTAPGLVLPLVAL